MIKRNRLLGLVAAFLALFSAAATIEAADDTETFFADKTLTFYVGFGPGGGYDSYSRLVARHLGQHIPGKPNVIVKNMPGAGSLTLANYLYNVAPRDGTAMGMIEQSLPLNQVMGEPGIKFDAFEFSWIGRVSDVTGVLVAWAASPITSIEDATRHEFSAGMPGIKSVSALNIIAMNNMLGTRFKLVSAYSGSRDVLLALERGEVDVTPSVILSQFDTSLKHWVTDNKIRTLTQFALTRAPQIKDVPMVWELAKNDADRRIFRLLSSTYTIGRSVVGPPGLPANRLQALRRAFDATMADPALRQEAARTHEPVNPLKGEEIAEIVREAKSLPPELITRAKAMTSRKAP